MEITNKISLHRLYFFINYGMLFVDSIANYFNISKVIIMKLIYAKIILTTLFGASIFNTISMENDTNIAKVDCKNVVIIAKKNSDFFLEYCEQLQAENNPTLSREIKAFQKKINYYTKFIDTLENIKKEYPFDFYIYVPLFVKKYFSHFNRCIHGINTHFPSYDISEIVKCCHEDRVFLGPINQNADIAIERLFSHVEEKKSNLRNSNYPKPLRV